MKKNYRSHLMYAAGFVLVLVFNAGCKKSNIKSPAKGNEDVTNISIYSPINGIEEVNLVANKSIYNPSLIDENLLNAWGIAADPDEGDIWVSANHAGVSTVYDKLGNTLQPPVFIPAADGVSPGAPTGVIYNTTTDFKIHALALRGTVATDFIFAGEDGTISAWASGASAATLSANRSGRGAVYKGIALADDSGNNFLYVANFGQGKVDVFDKNFNYVKDKPFIDASIPKGYAPFNIRNINGNLYVTYAFQKVGHQDDSAGLGRGYINIFTPGGMLIKRFASQGKLNSPWGMVSSSPGFTDVPNAILIGNFGDGRINVFDDAGNFKGQLMDKNNHPIIIDGLWALENNIPGISMNQLYFTAGPAEEEDGIFGYLIKK